MARRRANGEGSIRKRSDGSWEGRITIGYDPFGKQVMKSVYGRTQRDVKEKLERLKADLEGKSAEQAVQSDSDSGKDKKEVIGKEAENTGDGICMLTLEQWLDIWRKQYLSNVKPGTVCHYESVCRLHIVPALGNIPLVKLRTPAIQKFYIDLQEKGLSPKYIKNIHGCLHKALDIAVRIDYITKNPTSACIIPRVIQKEMHPLDAPEQVQLLQSLKGKKNEALIVTALFILDQFPWKHGNNLHLLGQRQELCETFCGIIGSSDNDHGLQPGLCDHVIQQVLKRGCLLGIQIVFRRSAGSVKKIKHIVRIGSTVIIRRQIHHDGFDFPVFVGRGITHFFHPARSSTRQKPVLRYVVCRGGILGQPGEIGRLRQCRRREKSKKKQKNDYFSEEAHFSFSPALFFRFCSKLCRIFGIWGTISFIPTMALCDKVFLQARAERMVGPQQRAILCKPG